MATEPKAVIDAAKKIAEHLASFEAEKKEFIAQVRSPASSSIARSADRAASAISRAKFQRRLPPTRRSWSSYSKPRLRELGFGHEVAATAADEALTAQTTAPLSFSVARARCSAGRACMRSSQGLSSVRSRAG